MALGVPSATVGRRIVSVAFVVLLLSPLMRSVDGLPLSTYPMYASTRSPTLTLVTANGVDASGAPVKLSMSELAATLDPLIAQSFLNTAVATGSEAWLCREIAGRVERNVVQVQVARDHRDVVAHTQGDPSLLSRQVLATCEVEE